MKATKIYSVGKLNLSTFLLLVILSVSIFSAATNITLNDNISYNSSNNSLNITLNLSFNNTLVNTSINITNTTTINETNVSVNLSSNKIKNILPPGLLKKLHKDLEGLSYEAEAKVIVQLKDKNSRHKIKDKVIKGKSKISRDRNFIFADAFGSDVVDVVSDEDVVMVWPDLEVTSFLDDAVDQIHADSLWNFSLNGSGVKIAVLDTGVDASHEMLNGRVISQVDFTGSGTGDFYGHGTHVAGIASGNGLYKGVAFDSQIYDVKVLNDEGVGYLSWLIDGIDYAISENVDVISLSLGAIYSGTPENQLNSPEILKIEEAISNGITVVIASGNCGSGVCGGFEGVTTPGITRNAITVGTVDDANEWAYFSSGDTIDDYVKPDMVAPGVDICSAVPLDYDCKTGTSMSTPFVSGAVALLLQHNSSLNPTHIKDIFEDGALDLGDSGKDVLYGSGLLDLSNLNFEISPVEIIPDEYTISFSDFEIRKEGKVTIIYHNKETCYRKKDCKPRKIKVRFESEELDRTFQSEKTKTIPNDKYKSYKFKTTFNLPGKHLLKITIEEDNELIEEINTFIDVKSNFLVNSLGTLRLKIR
ncbi:MAG: S8 family serine peptidase [Nanoarchaeota archaeon]|nr:S8 family serine peptidase [DPANN group archaeon]MBL7116820.1 S8 family serine peptidase [Nanoarchaeota archaeon]